MSSFFLSDDSSLDVSIQNQLRKINRNTSTLNLYMQKKIFFQHAHVCKFNRATSVYNILISNELKSRKYINIFNSRYENYGLFSKNVL